MLLRLGLGWSSEEEEEVQERSARVENRGVGTRREEGRGGSGERREEPALPWLSLVGPTRESQGKRGRWRRGRGGGRNGASPESRSEVESVGPSNIGIRAAREFGPYAAYSLGVLRAFPEHTRRPLTVSRR